MRFIVFHTNPQSGQSAFVVKETEDEAKALSERMLAAGRQAFYAQDDGSDPYILAPLALEWLTVNHEQQTWHWDTGAYHSQLLLEKLALLAIATDSHYDPIFKTYPNAERESWMAQEAEAIAWLNDSSAPTPTLDALNPVETKAEFCQLVLSRAKEWKQALAIVGASQRVRDALKRMTIEELNQAQPETLLSEQLKALGLVA